MGLSRTGPQVGIKLSSPVLTQLCCKTKIVKLNLKKKISVNTFLWILSFLFCQERNDGTIFFPGWSSVPVLYTPCLQNVEEFLVVVRYNVHHWMRLGQTGKYLSLSQDTHNYTWSVHSEHLPNIILLLWSFFSWRH